MTGSVGPGPIGIVGAGTMGAGIAQVAAVAGRPVRIADAVPGAAERAVAGIRDRVKAQAAKGRLSADPDALDLAAVDSGDGLAGCEVVIEAIVEDLAVKRALFAELETVVADGTIFASNTSSLSPTALAAGLAHPERLVGLHFFNPVAQMPLVEIVRGEASSEDAVQKAIAFTRKIDKLPLPCKSAPGFLVNRVLVPYLYEAMFALQDGIPLETIDEAALRFGMPMGPVELADVVGLDVCKHVGDIVSAALNKQKPDTSRIDALIAAKKLGRKSGEGFYVWRDGKAVKAPGPYAAPPADLEDRLMLALANECVAVLREKIVADADLIDAGVIFGSGFAPFRGGPLSYARKRGVDAVVARLTELARAHGPRFTPDEGWSAIRDA